MRRVGSVLALLAWLACASSPPPAQKPRRSVLLTEHDDAVVGRESAQDVKAEIGVLEDSDLTAYVDGIGRKLLRGVQRRGFDYQFYVVDMPEPNAFALPGGYIFVSRGLLALANDEDELACVIGHEIVHAARRHAAAQQALMNRQFPLAAAQARFATMASYSREMEREADEGGQILCAAAGYDPLAMSTFMASLGNAERLTRGFSRGPSYFDTHPGTLERGASNAVRAREIRWRRDPELGDPRAALLRHTDGLAVGQRPEAGLFEGDHFVHPVLGFALSFPSGWKHSNSSRAVGAMAPRGEAMVYLTGDVPPGAPEQVAEAWLAREQQQTRLEVTNASPLKIAGIDAWRIEASAPSAAGTLLANITFIPFHDATYRITGAAPSSVASRHQAALRNTARSFRALEPGELRGLEVTRLRIAEARPGEALTAVGARAGNAWSLQELAVYNGVFVDHRFAGGELVKVSRSEPYQPPEPPQR